jgi:sugar/nucleoside kinase (ribokinase family)
VVIKNGAGGAFAYHGDETYYEPAIHVEPVDTTGAGDVFNAGFLAATLSGHDLPTALHWGAFCGGRSTLGPGGATTAPTRAELDAWLKTSG